MSSWRTVSIFISSTFMDMDAERDHLQNFVLKRLAETLAEHKVQVRPVDLRWGISVDNQQDSDFRNAEILKVCFDEIERCRPFFVLLAGDRYGWIPSSKEYLRSLSLISGDRRKGLPEDVDGNSVTAMEVIYGALQDKEHLDDSLFFFRNADYSLIDPETIKLYVEEDEVNSERIKSLKSRIVEMCDKNACRENVHEYDAGGWDGNKKVFTDLSDFGNQVYDSLLAKIKSKLELSDKSPAEMTWYEEEDAANRLFRDLKLKNFRGREGQIDEMKKAALSPEIGGAYVFQAASGWGKSALMSRLYEELCSDCSNKIVLFHSVGVTERSISVSAMLQRFSYEISGVLKRPYDELDVMPGSTADDIYRSYFDCVDAASESGYRVIVLIDGFENLTPSENYGPFYFMNNSARYILTGPDGDLDIPEGMSILQKRIDGLSYEEATEILTDILDKAGGKTIDGPVLQALMSIRNGDDYAYRSPLWLTICCDMLFSLDGDDFTDLRKSDNYIEEFVQSFSGDSGNLFCQLLARIMKHFGQEFTVSVLGLLSVSRRGLRESDLAALVREWSPLKFAQLRRWLIDVVVEVGAEKQWDLQFQSLKDALVDVWGPEQSSFMHSVLGGHFNDLPDNDYLKPSEAIYHMIRGNMLETASDYLSSMPDEYLSCAINTLGTDIKNFPPLVDWVAELIEHQLDEEGLASLSSRLIYDLNHALETDGSFELRRTLLHAVAEKLESRDDLSQPVLFILISCYHDLGALYASADFDNGAKHCFGKALRLLDSVDENSSTCLVRSQIYCRLGGMMMKVSDFDGAEFMLKSGVEMCMEVSRETGPDFVSRYLSDLYLALGNLYKRTGKIQEASECYKLFGQYADGVEEKVADPADKYLVFEQEGDIYYESADYEKALEAYRKAKDGFADILSKNPSEASALRNLISMHGKIGKVYLQMPMTFRQRAINCFVRMFNKSIELLRLDDSSPENMQIVATSAYDAAVVQIESPEFCNQEQVETLLNTSYHFWKQLHERYGSDEYKEKCDQIEAVYSSIFE